MPPHPVRNLAVRLLLRSPALVLFALFAAIPAACGGPEGIQARDFEVTQFDGARFRLSEEIGRNVVVLNFWYPSCPPCRDEMPAFEAAWQELQGEPVRFLGLFVPQGFDSEQDARDFVAELGLTFDFATDRLARIAEAYELEAFPKTYFIDMQGRIVSTYISSLEKEAIVRQARALTGKGNS